MLDAAVRVAPGEFGGGSFANGSGLRDYKLFVPRAYHGQALPLVVLLHGCTQDADDFAAGTKMNAIADEHDCFVLYPQQSRAANATLCWNWFNAADQQRDRGEPSIIADLTRAIIRTYGVEKSKVFVAGMSAGGAMAVIVGAMYPEIFSAVGIHSGMPYQAAQNVFTAMSAMRRGAEDYALKNLAHVRAITFHGSKDTRVHPRNSEQIIVQLLGADPPRKPGKRLTMQTGTRSGRSFERKIFRDAEGRTLAEQWLVKGTAHAWSGGSPEGSHTDPTGPDASREMLRFFLGGPDRVESAEDARSSHRILRRALRALKLLPAQDH